MEEFDRLSILLQKSATLKEHITTFREFITKLDSNNPAQITELQLRYNTVYSSFTSIDDLFDEIQLIDSETNHSQEKRIIQDLYYETFSIAQNSFASYIQSANVGLNSTYHRSASLTNENVNESIASSTRRKIKLPQATLPTFSGKMEEWLSFKDIFDTMINKRDDLSNIEKLQYLKSVLKDEALRKIQVFAITEDNYERAWKLLQKSYEDKRILISRHLSLLLRLPIQEKESYTGLISLADESQQHLQSLASLGVNVTHEIVIAIIEEKLHKLTLEKWEETIKQGEFPSLEDLTEFLYRTAARISKRKNNDSQNDNNKEVSSAKKRKTDFKRQAFVTTTTKKCPLCSESHLLFKCGKFLALKINERFKTVKDSNLCVNCLRNHKVKDCKFGACKKCNKKHNTLLHFPKQNEQTDKTESTEI
ncbi:uncharacterized protein LOC122504631 [Leptopilina heterotoma]|uniref:uncharacterized protein LOC122504631 n=1 Tax=Leptopilina heterotoma TaxID=63436 RepID=UPI001CA90EA2|nr:uncharacterized protein LOC122504631 [Leptopilina heterotoma]